MFVFLPCEVWTTPFKKYLLITKGIDKIDYDTIQDSLTIIYYSSSYLFVDYDRELDAINKLSMKNIHFQILKNCREDKMEEEEWRVTNGIKPYLHGF